jgi:predicted branched-subunit amino acid permease
MNAFKKGLTDGIPIALGYISVSFTFGLQGVSMGLTWWQAFMISLTNLTSAGQFAGLEIMLRGGGLFVEMACTQLVINLRYALMSLSLSQKMDECLTGIHRWLVGFGITDEIFAVAAGQKEDVGRSYMYGLILLPLCGWVGGTLLGAVAGQLLPAAIRSALGIAIYAMFIAIIIPPAKKNRAILKVVALAVLLSCAFHWLPVLNRVSSGFVIIICAVAAAAFGALAFPVQEDEA